MHETQNEKHNTQQQDMIDLREMWLVEWSEPQGWFHVGQIEDMIGKNIRAYIAGDETDYAIVGITDTQDEAEKLMGLLQAKRKAPISEPLADFFLKQNEDGVELLSHTAPPPPAKEYKLKPLASAARKNHFKPVPLSDGREIIPIKRR